MYQLIHPSSFFIGLFAFRPFKILSGVMATLICSAGHDRPSRACSAPSSMPNDLKQGHCSGKLPGRTGGKRFFAARTGLSIHNKRNNNHCNRMRNAYLSNTVSPLNVNRQMHSGSIGSSNRVQIMQLSLAWSAVKLQSQGIGLPSASNTLNAPRMPVVEST